MLQSIRYLLLIVLLQIFAACSFSRHIPQPILERSGGTLTAGDSVAAQVLRTCHDDVHASAPMTLQPRWIPPLGVAANGVVLGTVDVGHPVWPSREAYRQEMERCLRARGYEIRGWQ